MAFSGGYSKLPHVIMKELAEMSLPEVACTLVLVRETLGWHREYAWLRNKDFRKATPIRSKTTIRAALQAVEARGFFRRTRRRSVWVLGERLREEYDGESDGAQAAGSGQAGRVDPDF
jgi:hypothetical protein